MRKINLQKTWTDMSPDEKVEMADALHTPMTYLSQVSNGHSKPGRLLLKHIALYLEVDDPKKIDLKTKPIRPRS